MADATSPNSTAEAAVLEPEEARLDAGEAVLLGELSLGPGDPEPSRDQVEPYLAALLQAEHLNLLIGSGLTVGLSFLAEFKDGADMASRLDISDAELSDALETAA